MVCFNQQIKEDIKMYNPFDDYKIIKECKVFDCKDCKFKKRS